MSRTSYPGKRTCIYVVGPSSTGKTTLCDALTSRLGLASSSYVKEVAREVMQTRGFTRNTIGLMEMQEAIMDAQLGRENQCLAQSQILLCDRSAVDPVVYAVLTAATPEEAIERKKSLTESKKFQEALERYRDSVFVLLEPVAEWLVDDGTRHIDNQEECYGIFEQILSELGIWFRPIGPSVKNLEERTSLVASLVV
ncbi:AAA domain-containing protein [Mycena floridula]|nr:AAA domain-containing protein [Mycena floridula]